MSYSYTRLRGVQLTYDVDPELILMRWPLYDENTEEGRRLAYQIINAQVQGLDTIRISDENLLEELGVIRRGTVPSETSPGLVSYDVLERHIVSGWEKVFCSCQGFSYHGHCKHTLERSNER